MKIQLDTDNKIIKLESDVLLSDLVKTLNKILPNGEWKTFTLKTHTTISHWHEPIIIHDHYERQYWQPWYTVTNTYMASNKSDAVMLAANTQATNINNALELKSGVYNLEV